MYNYITYEQLKDFTNFSEIKDMVETKLTDIIAVAEAVIHYVCGQSFDKDAAATKVINGNDMDVLWVPKRLYKVTTVTIDDLDMTTWVLLKFGNKFSRLAYDQKESIRIRVFKVESQRTGSFFTYGKDNVSILGDWGWSTVPEEVKTATKYIAERVALLEADTRSDTLGLISEQLGDYQYRKESKVSMPAEVKEDFVKRVVGRPAQFLLAPYVWEPIYLEATE